MSEQAVISYQFNQSGAENYLLITDEFGKRVAIYHISSQTGEFNFNKMQLAIGVYFCYLQQAEQIIAAQKLVIQ